MAETTLKSWKKEKTPRSIASAAKKEKIYTCAVEMFKEYGYDEVSVKDISRVSGISEGSIYNFFGSKAGILAGFTTRMFARTAPFIELTEENLSTPYDSILNAYYAHGEIFAEMGAELTAMYYNNVMEITDVSNITEPDRAVSLLYQPMYDFISEAVNRGTLKLNASAEEFASTIYTYCNGIVLVWTRCGGAFDLMSFSRPSIKRLIDSFLL